MTFGWFFYSLFLFLLFFIFYSSFFSSFFSFFPVLRFPPPFFPFLLLPVVLFFRVGFSSGRLVAAGPEPGFAFLLFGAVIGLRLRCSTLKITDYKQTNKPILAALVPPCKSSNHSFKEPSKQSSSPSAFNRLHSRCVHIYAHYVCIMKYKVSSQTLLAYGRLDIAGR